MLEINQIIKNKRSNEEKKFFSVTIFKKIP